MPVGPGQAPPAAVPRAIPHDPIGAWVAAVWRGTLGLGTAETHEQAGGSPMFCMRRREFIALVGGAAAAWPLAARAQQSAMPVIGYLNLASPESDTNRLTGLRRGLNETGYVEGRNLVIEYRWAANQADRLAALAADLVQLRVAVIVSPG